MDIGKSIYMLLDSLIQVTILFVRDLIYNLKADPLSFVMTAVVALFGYLLLNIYKYIVTKKKVSVKLDMIVYILSPFIYILFTYYAVQSDAKNALYIILNYLGFYWLASVLMRVPFKYFAVKIRVYYMSAMILIGVAFLLSVYIDIAVAYSGQYGKELKSIFLFADGVIKVLLSIGIFIYVKGILPQSVKLLITNYPRLAMIATLVRLMMLGYVVVAVLWVLNIIVLDFRAVMAVALLGILMALMSYVMYKTKLKLDLIYPRSIYTELEWMHINKNMSRFIFVVFVYIYYVLIYNALNMGDVLIKLKKMYLFETKLFSLSVFSLIAAFFIFVFLKSLLFLFTKYLRVVFENRDLADDSDSMEVIVYNLGLLMVVMSTLLQLGVTWQIVVPIAGALGIGIGFGLQTVINNYICGFILLFSKKIRIGDFVELPGNAGSIVGVSSDMIFGRVVSIDMFATTVQTFDNIEIMVPNSVFISETIINYTRSDKYVRVRVPVGIAYSSDVDKAMELMKETIDECEFVDKLRSSDVWFIGYGSSSLDFVVLFWLNMAEGFQITKVKSVFLTSLWHKFKEHGIEIPFPQQDVWFRNELHIADKVTEEKD